MSEDEKNESASEDLVGLGGGAWRRGQGPGEEEAVPEDADVEVEADFDPAEARARQDGAYGPEEEEPLETEGLSPVNVRNFSVKCGRCDNYQVLVSFRRIDDEWNAYVYECDAEPCVSEEHRSRTIVEIPAELDEYARRDPTWHGGKKHAGAEQGS